MGITDGILDTHKINQGTNSIQTNPQVEVAKVPAIDINLLQQMMVMATSVVQKKKKRKRVAKVAITKVAKVAPKKGKGKKIRHQL